MNRTVMRSTVVGGLLGMGLTLFSAMAVAATPGADGLVGVIIKLKEPPLAAYAGRSPGLVAMDATVTSEGRLNVSSPRSRSYLNYFNQQLQAVENSIGTLSPTARITHRYPVVFGGLAARVPANQLSQLDKLPGVQAVYPDKRRKVDTTRSPRLIKADRLWSTLGGSDKGGEGMVVGIIDTGIWPEHPSFANPDQNGKAYPPPPASWGGICEAPLDGLLPIQCNNKLIGARLFLDTYKSEKGVLPAGAFNSPRDEDGHGTHVASTAAGNGRVDVSIMGSELGRMTGVAPRAHVAMYKALGPDGGYTSDLVAAINQAVQDGVDVINYSIGPTDDFLVDPYASADDMAFLDAYKAGVFVATSAGNSGPESGTVNHLGGWTTTVAASSNERVFTGSIALKAKGGGLKLAGSSLTGGIKKGADFVLAKNYGDELCLQPFAAATFSGKIVGCRRGTNARVEKGYNVLQGGAAGMVLYNASDTAQGVVADNHYLPTIHLDGTEGERLLTYLQTHATPTASFSGGKAKRSRGDMTANFSSRGGAGQQYGISKPDLAAPGTDILAGNTAEPRDTAIQKPGQLFTVMEGTSMASPHVAGAGALLKQLNPGWTPGQIKSALMTSAFTKLYKEDGETVATPFDVGSGRIDLQKAARPGLTFDVPGDDFVVHKDDLWKVNYPSIYIPQMGDSLTVTRTARSNIDRTTKWKVSVTSPADLEISVNQGSSLTIPGNGDETLTITINAAAVPPNGLRHGMISLKSGSYLVHIPVTIVKASIDK